MDTEGNETGPQEIPVEDQLRSITALLGAVLLEVGEPVRVTHEAVFNGIQPGARIVVDNHVDTAEYVLFVEVPK